MNDGITNELRKYADELDTAAAMKSEHGFSPIAMRLCGIADRIDAAHKREADEQYDGGYNKGCDDGFDEGFASADDWYVDHADELAEHGWVRLPVDADGEVIHIGDVMDTEHFGTVEVEGFVHDAVAFYNYSGQPAYICTAPANKCRHHHNSTVEDVLREFTDAILEWAGKSGTVAETGTWSDVASEYADRIRDVLCDAQ